MRPVPLIVALVTSALLPGCDATPSTQGAAPPVRPVLSTIVSPDSIESEAFAGTIQARASSPLAFSVPGRVVSRRAGMGDQVAKGETLAALDAVPFDLAVQSARADLANAEAQRATTLASESRLGELYRQKTLATSQFEAAQQAREVADAAVARTRALLDIALDQRARTELNADFDGVVTAVPVEVGQTITAGQPVVTLVASNQLEAVIDVPEDTAKNLSEETEFQVTSQTSSADTKGKVREVSPRFDALTKSRRVRIALNDAPASLRLGSTIVARAIGAAASVTRLPETAVLERDGKAWVWVVDAETLTVSEHAIETADRRNGLVDVIAGISPGARVVTAGVHSLSQGQTVKISPEAP